MNKLLTVIHFCCIAETYKNHSNNHLETPSTSSSITSSTATMQWWQMQPFSIYDPNFTGQSEEISRTRLELMAVERDMKRRRQKFKGGKTHTANKSYTEVR